jgi:hypothetical protein
MTYGFIGGLLFGAGVGGHALRFTMQPDPAVRSGAAPIAVPLDRTRAFIAGSAMLIYGLGAALCLFSSAVGLWIAILFPIVGVTAVLVTGHKLDAFQIVLGIFQAVAAVLSILTLLSTVLILGAR